MFYMDGDTDSVEEDVKELASGLVETYLSDTVQDMHRTTFRDDMICDVVKMIKCQLQNLHDHIDEDMVEMVTVDAVNGVYGSMVPDRSTTHRYLCPRQPADIIRPRIQWLLQQPQPEQRTPGWYKQRYNLLTASSAHKALGTQGKINETICSKCAPFDEQATSTRLNTESPCHWGVKYEPVSTLYYEEMNRTKVTEFGCIVHKDIPFLGASPDGIVTDEASPLYGRMLEIKNPFSRIINGIPKDEYWIQMQMQLEVCDLDYCDFLETKFTEYESREMFDADGDFTESTAGDRKGVIMFFMNDGIYHYEYPKLGILEEEFTDWEQSIMDKNSHMSWVTNIYWKLEDISCVVVARNTLWFNSVTPKLYQVWDTILEERKDGSWKARLPQARKKKDNISSTPTSASPCTPSQIITMDI